MNDKYIREARKRWGDTKAYKESERRTANYSQNDWDKLSAGMDEIMAGFAQLKATGTAPDDEPARRQVEKLKQFITDKMYNCTDDILRGLGQIYVADERFTNSIDKHGQGTAEYACECIKKYLA